MDKAAKDEGRLDAIYQLGERMLAALENGDADEFANLLSERSGLVDELDATDAGSANLARKLIEQRSKLDKAADDHLRRLQNALDETHKLHNAQRSYGKSLGPDQILNRDLRG